MDNLNYLNILYQLNKNLDKGGIIILSGDYRLPAGEFPVMIGDWISGDAILGICLLILILLITFRFLKTVCFVTIDD